MCELVPETAFKREYNMVNIIKRTIPQDRPFLEFFYEE